jgi:hypothetical protein
MLDELTFEEYSDWLEGFKQDPWDEQRKDDRSAVQVIWLLRPHAGDGDMELPSFYGPNYSPEEESGTQLEQSIARIEAVRRKHQLNGK